MAAIKLVRMDDFTGGLNLRADPFQLSENESPDLLNVDIDPRGGFSIRPGMTRLNTTAIDGLGADALTPQKLFNWSGASPQLLLAANSKVYYSTAGATWTDTTIATSFADGASFAPWTTSSTSVVYVACGIGTVVSKWSGSADTALTASATGQWQESLASPIGTHMPKSNLNAAHVDRMWVAYTSEDGTTYKNRIRFSHPLFPESWRSDDYIDIPAGGDGITALVPWGDALLIFKRKAIFALYGYDTDTFQLTQLTGDVGVPNSKCVAATEHGLYFFDWPKGLFRWDGSKADDLFARLRPLIELGDVNATSVDKVWVSQCHNRIWVSLPQGADTSPTYSYVFDYTINAWTRYQLADSKGMACLTDFVASSGARSYVGIHPTQPYCLNVAVLDYYEDDITGTPAAYDSWYTTRWVDAGLISAKKLWRQPDFVVKQPDTDLPLQVEVFRDWEEAAPRRTYTMTVPAPGTALVWAAEAAEPDAVDGWNEASWGGGAVGAQYQRGQRLGLARSVQLRISGPGSLGWGVNSITYKYTPRRIR